MGPYQRDLSLCRRGEASLVSDKLSALRPVWPCFFRVVSSPIATQERFHSDGVGETT
jgi:hypothetical protein